MQKAGVILEEIEAEGGDDLAVDFAGYAVEVLLQRKTAPRMQPLLDAGAVDDQLIQSEPVDFDQQLVGRNHGTGNGAA